MTYFKAIPELWKNQIGSESMRTLSLQSLLVKVVMVHLCRWQHQRVPMTKQNKELGNWKQTNTMRLLNWLLLDIHISHHLARYRFKSQPTLSRLTYFIPLKSQPKMKTITSHLLIACNRKDLPKRYSSQILICWVMGLLCLQY